MNRVAILGVWLGVSLSLGGLSMACSSSTTSPGYGDGGCQPPAAQPTDAGCMLQTTTSTCGMGNTCCLGSPVPLMGVCQQAGSCSSNFQFECHNKSECSCGQLCCATFMVPDAGPGPFSTQQELSLLMMSSAKSECAATCPSGQTQLCTADSDCPSGMHCQEFFSAGDAGASVASVLMSFQGCF
ncbi:MAG TPA: hypothetical protein VKU41_28880 [Polyangiaceae bacterium]|nr:hypothetical protein [Polyangiaceae bacterium]